MSGVRSKIATFEAQSAAGGGPTTATTPTRIKSSSSSSSLGIPHNHHYQQPSPVRPSPSTQAAQNRVSRIRQEQQMMTHKEPSPPPPQLQQQQQKQQQTPVSLTRRTQYESSRRAHNHNEDNQDEMMDKVSNNNSNGKVLFGKESASPSRGGGNRLSKMQRMQRMLGHGGSAGGESSKKGTTTLATSTTTSSVPTSSTTSGRKSIAESSTISAATTAVVKNSSSSTSNPVVVQPRRQRQTSLMQSRVKRHSAMNNYKQSPTAQDKFPSATTTATITSTPSKTTSYNRNNVIKAKKQAAFSGLPSPTASDGDTFGPTDQSIDPDDEATLTSVRQIMNGEHHNSSAMAEQLQGGGGATSDRSYHYQNLQNFEDSTRGRSTAGRGQYGEATNTKSTNATTVTTSTTADGGRLSRKHRRSLKNAWPQEEKSDKGHNVPRVFRTTSSSDYDTDGDGSKQSNTLDGPTHSQLSEVNEFFTQQQRYNPQRRMVDDDENTFDYGDKDDDGSNASASFAMRQRRFQTDPSPPETAPSNEWKETNKPAPSSLINKDDVEHYTKSLGSPTVRMGVGVLAGVTIGCIMLGPAGLLAGAALVGLGIGAMQIPEEERHKIQVKVQETAHQVQEKALDATEKLSNRCAATYEESGVAEHLPPCLASIPIVGTVVGKEQVSIATADDQAPAKTKESVGPTKGGHKGTGGIPPLMHEANHPRAEPTMSSMDRARNKKVACLRNVRILPAGKIHGLDPSAQPKAWLDVVASANTSEDEKIEALEEILILAKDKRRAQILLEEGILDSLVWTLDRFIEKVNYDGKSRWADPTITPNERRSAKLAASCCVTLGKTHCAAIHMEGDMQLISLYESGPVPEERQVAHMLHDVPHHVRITKLEDPTIVIPKKEIFGLRQLSLQQADDLAQSIRAVIDGKLG